MTAKMRCLAIVERAFRGAIEEQYGHILWLTRSLRKMRGEVGLMLRGHTVLYGLKDQPRQVLEIGGVRVDSLPHYESAVRALLADGVAVYADRGALRQLGVEPGRLVEGVVLFGADDFPAIVRGYDRVWYW